MITKCDPGLPSERQTIPSALPHTFRHLLRTAYGFNNFGLGRLDVETIEKHEFACDNERHAFVAIYKRVVSRNAEAVACRKSRERSRPFVVKYNAVPKECGLEKPLVSNAVETAVARDLSMVDLQGHGQRNPAGLNGS